MIKLIGFKRMLFLTCVVMLNLSVLGAYFFSIGPMLDDVNARKDAVDGQIADLHTKIASVKQDIQFVKDNLPKYDELQSKGFFQSQDRFTISRTMETLRLKAGISSFAFSVADVAEIPNADAAAINYRLINSRIKVNNIVSPLNSNIYALAQDMTDVFPDYARIQNMNIVRTSEVTEATLKQIAEGKPVNFVNADLEFDWITMVPKPAESAAGPGGAPAGFRRQ